MNYQEIIKPYLIDFDKLEVGQTIWSVQYGKVKIDLIARTYFRVSQPNGNKINIPFSIYNENLFFISNPFENLQRVEPLGMEYDEACEYHCTQGGQTPKECDVENAIELLEKEGYIVLNLQNYNKNRIDYQSNPYPAELG